MTAGIRIRSLQSHSLDTETHKGQQRNSLEQTNNSLCRPLRHDDPQWADLAKLWADLPDEARKAILELARAYGV